MQRVGLIHSWGGVCVCVHKCVCVWECMCVWMCVEFLYRSLTASLVGINNSSWLRVFPVHTAGWLAGWDWARAEISGGAEGELRLMPESCLRWRWQWIILHQGADCLPPPRSSSWQTHPGHRDDVPISSDLRQSDSSKQRWNKTLPWQLL